MLIVDAHEDLAWNMLTFGRDYLHSAVETRRRERETQVPALNGDAMLGWPDYQAGGVGLVFATLFASPMRRCTGDWDKLCYEDGRGAGKLYRDQIDLYNRLTDDHPDKFRLVHNASDLDGVLRAWESSPVIDETGGVQRGNPVGLVLLMEGADAVSDPGELDEWWECGLRLIGPAWVGTRYSGGTLEPGPLTGPGRALLERMGELGFGLDLSHMDEAAVFQALDDYRGVLFATHSNAQALLKGDESNRHLSDAVIRGILEREGVIGINFYNAYLKPGWSRSRGREEVTIEHLAAQIDYICQMAGDARHVGLGSDFDGGLGLQSVPAGIDTVADLKKLAPHLAQKGYSDQDCAAISGGNWITILRRILH